MTVFITVVAILFLLLMLPLKLHFTIINKTVVVVGWAVFKKQIFPAVKKAKAPKEKKPKKEKTKKAKEKEEKTKLTVEDMLEYVGQAQNGVKRLFVPVRKLIKRTKITHVDLLVNVASDDAFAVAMLFPKVSAAVYTSISILDSIFTLKVKRVEVSPNFCLEKTQFMCDFWVKIRPFYLLVAGLNIAFIALCEFLKFMVKFKSKDNDKIDKTIAIETVKQKSV